MRQRLVLALMVMLQDMPQRMRRIQQPQPAVDRGRRPLAPGAAQVGFRDVERGLVEEEHEPAGQALDGGVGQAHHLAGDVDGVEQGQVLDEGTPLGDADIYIGGTASLMIALPAGSIDAIAGIPQALTAVGERIGLPLFGALTAVLMALGNIGGVSAWISGTTRLPFVVGVDRHLPAALARLHPVHGTPQVSLIVQGVLSSLILLAVH